jgi:hypothetical protein
VRFAPKEEITLFIASNTPFRIRSSSWPRANQFLMGMFQIFTKAWAGCLPIWDGAHTNLSMLPRRHGIVHT